MPTSCIAYKVVQSDAKRAATRDLTQEQLLVEYGMFGTPLYLYFKDIPAVHASCALAANPQDGLVVTLISSLPEVDVDQALADMLIHHNYAIPGLALIVKSKTLIPSV